MAKLQNITTSNWYYTREEDFFRNQKPTKHAPWQMFCQVTKAALRAITTKLIDLDASGYTNKTFQTFYGPINRSFMRIYIYQIISRLVHFPKSFLSVKQSCWINYRTEEKWETSNWSRFKPIVCKRRSVSHRRLKDKGAPRWEFNENEEWL